MKQSLLFILSGLFLAACGSGGHQKKEPQTIAPKDSVAQTPAEKNERFKITGYFNDDKIIDTLYEWCYSALTHKPIQTYEVNLTDTTDNIGLIIKQEPITQLYTNINGVDTFLVSNAVQQQGLSYLMNLGDLNADHTDEVGYVIDNADMTNLNRFYIISLKNNKFIELFNFPINEALSFDPAELIDSTSIIKLTAPKTIQYKFYSDTATFELGTYTFK